MIINATAKSATECVVKITHGIAVYILLVVLILVLVIHIGNSY